MSALQPCGVRPSRRYCWAWPSGLPARSRRDAFSKSQHPIAAAAALASMLERLATYHAELEKYGVGRDDLIETCAAIMVRTLSAQSAATAL